MEKISDRFWERCFHLCKSMAAQGLNPGVNHIDSTKARKIHKSTIDNILTTQKDKLFHTNVHENHNESNVIFRIVDKRISNTSHRSKRQVASNKTPSIPVIEPRMHSGTYTCSKTGMIPASAVKDLDDLTLAIESMLNMHTSYHTGTLLKLSKIDIRHSLIRYESYPKKVKVLSFNSDNYFSYISFSKENSLRVQDALPMATETEITHLVTLTLHHLKDLLCHRYASYLVGKLIEKSENLASICAKIIFDRVDLYLVDEFGSRVAQQLTNNLPWFCQQALPEFVKNWEVLSRYIAPVFFINHVMKITNKKEELACIKDCLLRNAHQLHTSRYFKRIVLSFVRYCDPADFDEISMLLYSHNPLTETMNDQYLALCVSILLDREHHGTMEILANLKPSKVEKLLKVKLFRSLCQNVALEASVQYKTRFMRNLELFLLRNTTLCQDIELVSTGCWFALWLVIKYTDKAIIFGNIKFVNLIQRFNNWVVGPNK